MHSWNWDDLRLVLAVDEHKSLAAAARALGVNHSTVLRRINAFEKQHSLRLFDRLPSGYAITGQAGELLLAARAMKGVVFDLERRLIGQDARLEGRLRITTCDTLMASVLPEILHSFITLHPAIQLEVSTANVVNSLAERHADVAIRTGDAPSDTAIGRRVADVRFFVYRTTGTGRTTEDKAEDMTNWLAPDNTLRNMGIAKWISVNVPNEKISFRADSLVTLRQAALAGTGLALLPAYLGDTSPGLERLAWEGVEQLKTGLWVLSHNDLRDTARVRKFASFASEKLAEKLSA